VGVDGAGAAVDGHHLAVVQAGGGVAGGDHGGDAVFAGDQGGVSGQGGPRMLALAAERAQGAHPYLVTPEHTAKARAALGPDRWLLPEQAVVLETDPDQARTIGRRHISRYLDLPNYANNWRRLGFTDDDLVGQGSDRLVDALVAWGDVEAVRERVKDHLDAGADHVCVQVFDAEPHGMPLGQWRKLAVALL
jgi:probable F420-dependent oxidoreductase